MTSDNKNQLRDEASPPGPSCRPAESAHLTGWGKARRFLEILNVRLRFIFLMVIVGVVAGKWETLVNYYDRWTRPAASSMASDQATEYFCPMDPQIIKPIPGSCPICGMPLSKRAKTSGSTTRPEGVGAQVQMTPLKMALGRIATTQVDYRLMGREIRTVGQVDYDETQRQVITARIKGRLDVLTVNFTGQAVAKGDVLAKIYSPDLLVAQEELLLAAKAAKGADTDMAGQNARALLAAARKKLVLWGLTDPQIDAVIADGLKPGGKIRDHMEILSPMTGIVTEKKVLQGQSVMEGQELYTIADLGRVWMQVQVFEMDLGSIAENQVVEVSTRAYPNDSFPGKIRFIAYNVDPNTRTVSARIEIDNLNNRLKPGMYVEAKIHIPFGERAPQPPPATQPMLSPTHAVNTKPLLDAYLAVANGLAEDKADAAAIDRLTTEAAQMAERLPAARGLAEAAKLLNGKPIGAVRDQFKAVSQSLIKLVRDSAPPDRKLFLFNCSMEKGRDWLSEVDTVRNPYEGSKMLACGDRTGAVEPRADSGVRTSDDGRFVFGYYCPIHPEQLFDAPEDCPVNKPFQYGYVRAERMLAVPESAVIDTGERQVVYREASPGSFDQVQVEIGERAGEFYPVQKGLKQGDRVVTRGAFAVDAENRLNPAASVQYQGARSGPKADEAKSGHPH